MVTMYYRGYVVRNVGDYVDRCTVRWPGSDKVLYHGTLEECQKWIAKESKGKVQR